MKNTAWPLTGAEDDADAEVGVAEVLGDKLQAPSRRPVACRLYYSLFVVVL
jgi:hypothetical protein